MEFFDGVCNFAPFKGCQQISPGEGEKVTGGDKRGGGKGVGGMVRGGDKKGGEKVRGGDKRGEVKGEVRRGDKMGEVKGEVRRGDGVRISLSMNLRLKSMPNIENFSIRNKYKSKAKNNTLKACKIYNWEKFAPGRR